MQARSWTDERATVPLPDQGKEAQFRSLTRIRLIVAVSDHDQGMGTSAGPVTGFGLWSPIRTVTRVGR